MLGLTRSFRFRLRMTIVSVASAPFKMFISRFPHAIFPCYSLQLSRHQLADFERRRSLFSHGLRIISRCRENRHWRSRFTLPLSQAAEFATYRPAPRRRRAGCYSLCAPDTGFCRALIHDAHALSPSKATPILQAASASSESYAIPARATSAIAADTDVSISDCGITYDAVDAVPMPCALSRRQPMAIYLPISERHIAYAISSFTLTMRWAMIEAVISGS